MNNMNGRTIFRKRLFADGRFAGPNFPGNWDAAQQVLLYCGTDDYSGDDSRNLWTVIQMQMVVILVIGTI